MCAVSSSFSVRYHILYLKSIPLARNSAHWQALYTNLPLKGRKDLRGIIAPDKAEDAGGLTPGKDDNAVWRNNTRKAFDDLMED